MIICIVFFFWKACPADCYYLHWPVCVVCGCFFPLRPFPPPKLKYFPRNDTAALWEPPRKPGKLMHLGSLRIVCNSLEMLDWADPSIPSNYICVCWKCEGTRLPESSCFRTTAVQLFVHLIFHRQVLWCYPIPFISHECTSDCSERTPLRWCDSNYRVLHQ